MSNSISSYDWQGKLELSFAQIHGHSQLTHQYAEAPWKVQRPFYPEGGEICHCVPLHTAGGMVGGDRLVANWHLQPETRVLMTTPAASKIYRSNEAIAQQTIAVRLEAGSCLEWLPQETIIFNGGIYRQDLRIELDPGACWLGWELTRFGRSARGEKFLQGHWRSHTEVWRQGEPLWIDRQQLPASLSQTAGGLAGCSVAGTLAFVGQSVDPQAIRQIRDLWQLLDCPGTIGVTRLLEGLLCRYRGDSTQAARRWFTAVWGFLRPAYLGRTACFPRVWL